MSQFSPTVTSSTGEGFSLRPRKAAFPASLSKIPSLNYISYWCISLKSNLKETQIHESICKFAPPMFKSPLILEKSLPFRANVRHQILT